MSDAWLLDRLLLVLPLILSLTVHEWAHAWTAFQLGDDTAKCLGRMTLDPMAHIDWLGTVALPMLGVPFGWAKPVPVNPIRFRKEVDLKTGMMLTAMAGPLSNLVLALVCGCVLAALGLLAPDWVRPGAAARRGLEMGVLLNILLAVFNLLPIPPLDGSRIVDALVPKRLRPAWKRFGAASPVVLGLLLIAPLLLGFQVLAGPIQAIYRLIATLVPG